MKEVKLIQKQGNVTLPLQLLHLKQLGKLFISAVYWPLGQNVQLLL